eukprot:3934820-Rhodomonas_salina.1
MSSSLLMTDISNSPFKSALNSLITACFCWNALTACSATRKCHLDIFKNDHETWILQGSASSLLV